MKNDPQRGITIVGFTKEQVETYKQVKFKGTDLTLEIDDTFLPNEHSLEEAVVISTHPDQTLFKEGDSVLIDFVVFTSGKHPQFQSGSEGRYMNGDDKYDYYWLKDFLHPVEVSEVYAIINDKGDVCPIGDVVIIENLAKKEDGNIAAAEMIHNVPTETSNKTFATKVIAAPPDSLVQPGDTILCEAGYSPYIKFRGTEIIYINYPYIIGKLVNDQLRLL